MLKLLHARLPTDDKTQRFNYYGPSKCDCCRNPNQETIEHLFCEGDMKLV